MQDTARCRTQVSAGAWAAGHRYGATCSRRRWSDHVRSLGMRLLLTHAHSLSTGLHTTLQPVLSFSPDDLHLAVIARKTNICIIVHAVSGRTTAWEAF